MKEIFGQGFENILELVNYCVPPPSSRGGSIEAWEWSIGNCILTARRLHDNRTELELVPFTGYKPDFIAASAWQNLTMQIVMSLMGTRAAPTPTAPQTTASIADSAAVSFSTNIASSANSEVISLNTRASIAESKIESMAQWISEHSEPIAPATPTDAGKGGGGENKRGMTEERQQRAETFKRIKDAHPEFSYVKVAMEARKTKVYEGVTEDDVRNDYRAMGWTWERADKIR